MDTKEKLNKKIEELELELSEYKARCRREYQYLSGASCILPNIWNSSIEGMVLSDENGIVRNVNNKYCEIYGFDREELLNKEFSIIFPEDYRETAMQQYKELFKSSNIPESFEIEIIRKDGEKRIVESRVEFIKSDGKRTAMLSIIKDITEIKEAQKQIAESRSTLQAFFDSSTDSHFLLDKDYRILAFNKVSLENVRNIWGREIKKGDSIIDYSNPANIESFKENFQKALIGENIEKDIEIKFTTGAVYWFHVKYQPARNDDGEIFGVSFTSSDITEKKNSEIALKESEELFRGIFDGASDGMLLADAESMKFSMANKVICEMLGYTHEEVMNMTIAGIHPEESLPHLKKAFENGVNKGLRFLENIPVLKKDGSIIYVDLSSSVLTIQGGLYQLGIFRDVTERKKVESDLRRSRERLELAMEAGGQGYWDWNLKEDKLFFSDRYYTMLGYEPGELPMKIETWGSLLHPEDRENVMPLVMKHFENAEAYKEEFRLRCKDGNYKWISGIGKFFDFDSDGKPGRAVGIHVDIDKLKLAVNELMESELLLNETGRLAKIGGWSIDLKTNKLSWTREVYRIHEADEKFEPTVEKTVDFYDEESQIKIREALYEAEKSGKTLDMELVLITAGNKKKYVRAAGNVKTNKNNEITTIYGTFQDITDRKKALRALKESEEKYRFLYENINDLIGLHNPEGDYLQVSPSSERILGYKPEELIGKSPFSLVHPDDLKKIYPSELEKALKGEIVKIKVRKKLKNGDYRWFETISDTIYDERGKVKYLMTSTRDVQDTVAAMEELSKTNKVLQDIQHTLSYSFEEDFLSKIVLATSDILNADFAFAGSFTDESKNAIKTLALSERGSIRNNIVYDLENTPCNQVLNHNACAFSENIQELFPDDILLQEMNVEGYIGIPLFNTKAETIGIIVALYKNPIKEVDFAKNILEIFASRTAAEIERINSLKALKESEERLNLFFEKSLDGFFFMMLDKPVEWNDNTDKEKTLDYVFTHQRVTRVNKAFLDQYGYDEKDIIGMTPSDFFSHDIEGGKKVWWDFFDKGVSSYQTKERTAEGKPLWVEGVYTCFYDEKGRITGHFGIQRDVTGRVEAEKALAESEKRFRAIFENAVFGIATVDLEGRVTDVNPAFCKMIGFSRQELLTMKFSDFTSSRHIEKEEMLLEQLRRGEIDSYVLEKEYFSKSRGPFWVRLATAAIRDEQNRVTGYIGTAADIDDRKKAEDEIRKLSTAVTQSPAAIVITDRKGTIEYVNPRFSEITGYSFEEAVNKNPRVLKSGKHTQDYYRNLWQTISSGEIWQGDFYNRRKDGSFFWERAIIAPIKDENEKIINYVAVKQDITEQKEAEEKLKKSEKKLRESNATKDKFFSIIAHDLKNPFNTLLTMSKFIVDNFDRLSSESVLKELRNIRDASNHSYKLLENLLEWSRTQIGTISFNPEENDLYEIAVNNVYLFKNSAEAKGITLENKIQSSTYAVFDFDMINTVVRNLLSNAVKFTSEGGRVIISSIEEDSIITVAVSDSGVGIMPEHLDKIFQIDQSFSTKGTKNEKGTGLGLILCKEFVEKNGGRIWVESEYGKGSTFYFTLKTAKENKTKEEICSIDLDILADELETNAGSVYALNRHFDRAFSNAYLNRNIQLINHFSDELKKFAAQNNISILKNFSDFLSESLDGFDIERINICMEQFKEILEKLRD